MAEKRIASPVVFLFLMLPFGMGIGFGTVTLPFVLTRAGVSVAATGAVMAVALIPNTWRFLWGPVTDLTLSLRRWYLIALVASATSLIALGATPMRPDALPWITTLAVLSQAAANLTAVPVGGLMAHNVAEHQKGRAAGWYQAGNVGGVGLGGGVGIWLATHATLPTAGIVLATASLACAGFAFLVPDVASTAGSDLARRLSGMAQDFRELVHSRYARLVAVLVTTPIGVGAATGLWSAIAPDWRATPDLVALTSGLLAGAVSVAACAAGGWVADRVGRWWAYFGSGAVLALVGVLMAATRHTPATFLSGVLLYTFMQSFNNASFSALLLHAIGRGAASTKYALLSSAGNIPVIYMTALDGWAHDRWSAAGMLTLEALLALACSALALPALAWIGDRPEPAGAPAGPAPPPATS